MVMLTVCAVSVCTGVGMSVRAELLCVQRVARVGGEGVSAGAAVGTSAARGRTKRTPALDRSTEMRGLIGMVVEGGGG